MLLMQVRNLKDPGAQCLGSVISPSKFGTRPVRRSGTAWFCNSVPSALCHLSRLLQGDAVRWLLTIAAGPQQFEALLPEAAGNRKGKFFDLTQKILKE